MDTLCVDHEHRGKYKWNQTQNIWNLIVCVLNIINNCVNTVFTKMFLSLCILSAKNIDNNWYCNALRLGDILIL